MYFFLNFLPRGRGWLSVMLLSQNFLKHFRIVSAQSRLTLCYPMDCSLPGPSVDAISQARMLEWVAVSSSRGSSRPRDRTHVPYVSCIASGFFTREPLSKPKHSIVLLSKALKLVICHYPHRVSFGSPLAHL